MALEHKPWRQKLNKQNLKDAKDQISLPAMAYVLDYHPNALYCSCSRHQNQMINESTRHSVDIELLLHTKKQTYYDVPILEKAGGLDASPPASGDRVLIVFLHGDYLSPMVIGWISHEQKLPHVYQSPKIIRESGFYS